MAVWPTPKSPFQDLLDAHLTRLLSSLQLQLVAGLDALDAVVADTHLERLVATHDGLVVGALDADASHVRSFFVEIETPLLNHAVRRVPSREHSFERPAVTLEAGDLPSVRHQVNIQLVTVVRQEPLEVEDQRHEGQLVQRHEGHQLDRVAILGGRSSDVHHLAATFGDEDDLVLGVDVRLVPSLVAGEQGVNPVVVHSEEVAAHRCLDEATDAIGAPLLIERNDRDVGAVVPHLVTERL